MRRSITTIRIAATAAIACLATFAAAHDAGAASVADFYKGKTITLLVGGAPGGGYSIYANILAHHMGQHIPGKPTIIAKDYDGAGSLKATKIIYNRSPRDGTVFAAIFMGAVMEPMLGDKGTEFDATKLTYLGSLNRETSICIAWHTTPIKTFDDVFKQQMIVGASGWTSSIRQFPTVLDNVLGTKFKVIPGYKGSHAVGLAVERGETQGICGYQWSSFKSGFPSWLEENKVRILIQLADSPNAELTKRGVPMIWKYVKNKADERVLRLIFSQNTFGRPYVMPPGVPADRVAAMRAAFMATTKDPAFLAEAAKAKIEINPVDGQEVETLVKQLYKASPADVKRARAALGTKPPKKP